MRTLRLFVLAVLAAVAAVGCDSSENGTSDADRFVGSWSMVAFADGEGDRMPEFNVIANGLSADLTADGAFEILVDYRPETGNEPLTVEGTYTVEEGDGVIVLETAAGGNPPFEYEFETDDRVNLSADAAFVNGLFGTDIYTGTVTITIEK